MKWTSLDSARVQGSTADDFAAPGESVPSKLAVPWNGDSGQAAAANESALVDGSDTVRNGDAGETGAILKSAHSNGSDTVGNCDTGQAGAAIESLRSDGSNTVGNGDAF